MKFLAVPLAGALAFASAAHAQSAGMVSAKNPAGLVRLLQQKGLSPTLTEDSYGDPQIEFEIAGYQTTLMFYGCDEDSNDGCTSVQFRAGFDRDKPWTAAAAMEVSKKYRFASVWLDEAGDPWVQWDVMTGDGIPEKVFAEAVDNFGDTLTDTAEMVFAK